MKAFLLSLALFFGSCVAYANCKSLCERSPFCMKPPSIVEKQSNVNDEFEFHGVCSLDGECMFSLFNRTSNKRYWLKLGERSVGVFVEKYDKNRRIIELALPDGTIKHVRLSKFEFKPHLAQQTRNESIVVPVSEDARRKFLQIVRDGEK